MRWLIILLMVCWSNVVWAKQRVAVLEFKGTGVDQSILFQMSDEARGGAREGLPIQEFDITSRENLKQMLADMGKDMSACDVECEVTLGRVVGADYVLSGTIFQAEGVYILTLKLHDTMSGSLLGQKRIQNSKLIAMFSETYEMSRSMMIEKVVGAQQTTSGEQVSMTFNSTPSGDGVTVLVGGQPVCSKTPCTEKVPSGRHEVQILRKDYFPWIETHNISAGGTINANLKATFALISANTIPSGLDLTLNGTKQRISNHRIDPGTHRILVSDPCYISEGVEIAAEASSDESYTIRPQPKKSGVNVIVYDEYKEPVPATVYVDGQILGTAPLRSEVPLCAKKVTVKFDGASQSESLSLKEHTVKHLSLRLP